MVTWEQKIDKYGKIYICEVLRHAGFEGAVRITPNLKTALMHAPDATPVEIVDSLKVLTQHFQQMIGAKEEEKSVHQDNGVDPNHNETRSAPKTTRHGRVRGGLK